ncbi:MAG: hypothetical protein M3N98_16115 [Actinomycetota bacterium]|nr:hypothetical protein [Actinomycetota bacterium]
MSLAWVVLAPVGTAAAAPVRAAAPVTAAAATSLKGYTPVTPVRICDTRAVGAGVAANQCQGTGGVAGTLGAGSISVNVAGSNGVPATAIAAVLNVTVTNTTAASFLTVWPKGQTQPTASNLNWTAGRTVPNLVEVALGTNGAIMVFNSAGLADVIVDLEGYVDASSTALFNPLTPGRICDSRAAGSVAGMNQCQGPGGSHRPLGVGSIVVTVAGMAGVPANATSVVLNVTVTGTTTAGFLTVWPDGTNQPVASNLNWIAGQTVPNRVVVPLSPGGKIEVFNSAGITDVVIDVNGFNSDAVGGNGFTTGAPTRICDTRPLAAANPCNSPSNGGPLLAGDELVLSVPAGDTAIVINTTVVNTTAGSYLAVFPDPTPNSFVQPPLISDLNWTAGQIIANLVVVGSGPAQSVAFYNNAGTTDLVIDADAAYSLTPTAATASRQLSVAIRHHHPA